MNLSWQKASWKPSAIASMTQLPRLLPWARLSPRWRLLRIQTVRKSQSATRASLSTSPAASSHTYEVRSERSTPAFPYLKHLGIYAYRKEVLREVTQLPQSSLEIAESLEQLRWLQNGYKIKVTTDVETVGIDTPEDLQRAEVFLKEGH